MWISAVGPCSPRVTAGLLSPTHTPLPPRLSAWRGWVEVEPNSRGAGAFRHDRYVQFEASAAPGRVCVEAASKGHRRYGVTGYLPQKRSPKPLFENRLAGGTRLRKQLLRIAGWLTLVAVGGCRFLRLPARETRQPTPSATGQEWRAMVSRLRPYWYLAFRTPSMVIVDGQ